MIGAQLDLMGTNARGLESTAVDESEGLMTQTSLEGRPVLPGPWIRPRPQAPNCLRPCLSNIIGHRSWSLPPQIFFSSHPWAMC